MYLVRLERAVLERIAPIPRLGQVPIGEGVAVDDQDPARREVLEVRLQRRRIHRNEDVGRVPRGEDVVIGEMELEPRDAGKRPGRRPDLGGEVWEGRQVVAQHGGLVRELAPGQLHTVTGVSGEADDHGLELFDRLRGHVLSCSADPPRRPPPSMSPRGPSGARQRTWPVPGTGRG